MNTNPTKVIVPCRFSYAEKFKADQKAKRAAKKAAAAVSQEEE